MCALLASTSRAQAYVFKMDRAKIRPLLPCGTARSRTARAKLRPTESACSRAININENKRRESVRRGVSGAAGRGR